MGNWIFEQSTGKLYNPAGEVVETGYSGGNCGKNPEGKNNPDMQNVHCIGPIPVGIYTRGTVVMESHLGPFAIPLIPNADNEMFGRSDLYMHGDTTPSGNASEGCIIMSRAVRELFYKDTNDLQVVATYES